MQKELIKTNIRKLRLEAGITQEELAYEINSTKQNISKYERGEVIPPIDIYIDIANYFSVTLDHLVKEDVWTDENTIRLDRIAFEKNYTIGILDEHLSNININRSIFVPNLDTLLRYDLRDSYQKTDPSIPYLNPLESFLSDYYRQSKEDYDKAGTMGILNLLDMLKLINSLGANYDFYQHPNSLKLEMTNEFVVLTKLCSMLEPEDGIYKLSIDTDDLIFTSFTPYSNVTFTERGYAKHREAVNKILFEKYQQNFDGALLKNALDEVHFLLFLKSREKELPELIGDLYKEFNELGLEVINIIDAPFEKAFEELIKDKLLPKELFNLDLISKKKKNSHFRDPVLESAKKGEVSSLVNYLLCEAFERLEITVESKDYFFNFADYLGVSISERDIIPSSLRHQINNIGFEDKVLDYKTAIPKAWKEGKVGFLNLKTLKLIKSIINRYIKALEKD